MIFCISVEPDKLCLDGIGQRLVGAHVYLYDPPPHRRAQTAALHEWRLPLKTCGLDGVYVPIVWNVLSLVEMAHKKHIWLGATGDALDDLLWLVR